ncbi:MAG TPA: hypothetical protein VEH49_03240, partial [Methylomirabilota bacterium]|nr:hypothetical protein [Methylomirabilota bacterium]
FPSLASNPARGERQRIPARTRCSFARRYAGATPFPASRVKSEASQAGASGPNTSSPSRGGAVASGFS